MPVFQRRRSSSRFTLQRWHSAAFIFRLPREDRGGHPYATLSSVDDSEIDSVRRIDQVTEITSNELQKHHFELRGESGEYLMELRARDKLEFDRVLGIFKELGRSGLLAPGTSGELRVTTDQSIALRVQQEVENLQHEAKRELLRLVLNAKAKAGGDAAEETKYLRGLGRGDNMKYEVLPGRLDNADCFDIVLFREYTAVSNLLARIQRIHGE